MRINGKETTLPQNTTVTDMLKSFDYRPEIVAVEINEEIISKADYDTYIIKENDVVEIVQFMGGGCIDLK